MLCSAWSLYLLKCDIVNDDNINDALCAGRYVGPTGVAIGIDQFGASAPAPLLYEKFGITKEAVVAAAKKQLG